MSQIKDDLICEIIRLSQTNFLVKKQAEDQGEAGERKVVEWIKENAAAYRKNFVTQLDSFSAMKLSEILKTVTCSGKDLSEILEGNLQTPSQSNPTR